MGPLRYFSALSQSPNKAKQACHALAFICRKDITPMRKINRYSLRQVVKIAKKQGWDPLTDWREQVPYADY